jgi:exosome complex component RRP40
MLLFQVGNLVYARVTVANKDMEPELACVSTQGKAEGFGPLIGGYMFKCDTKLVREYVIHQQAISFLFFISHNVQ